MSYRTWHFLFALLLFGFKSFSQSQAQPILSFDFNNGQIIENSRKIAVKPVGVTLTDDRFGNKESAIYIHGHATSYLNLGSSNLLKPKEGSISLWVNIQAKVYAGKGFKGNMIIVTRNGYHEDFNLAYALGYNLETNRFGCQLSKDSLTEVVAFAHDTVNTKEWKHLVITYDNSNLCLYQDGQLQSKMIKNFEPVFQEGDSVVVGRTLGNNNIRFTHALIDDIRFFNYALSEPEIKALYEEPNPNRFKNFLTEMGKYGAIILITSLIAFGLYLRNRKINKQQKEQLELKHRVTELEIKVIKSQMNPHFISNSLAAIQDLVYRKENEKAGHYLAKFSFFMRQVLDYSDKTFITLKEELNLIALNVELEQLRFSENFVYELKMDEGIIAQQVKIPALITQPFIENAIWHGLLPLNEKRRPKLSIEVFKKNNRVYLSISDNGMGRKKELIDNTKISKGNKLSQDKVNSINQLGLGTEITIEVIDLKDSDGEPCGTTVMIGLWDIDSEE